MFYSLLFPRYCNTPLVSVIILFLRFFFGFMFMMHGLDKLNNFTILVYSYPDVPGLGSRISLLLTIFAEVICSLSMMLGFLFRPALLPMIVTMLVAFLWVHHASVDRGELSFVYMWVFVLLFVTGPGLYSIDNMLDRYISGKKNDEEAIVANNGVDDC